MTDKNLQFWRKKINEIDDRILGLLNDRVTASLSIGRLKSLNHTPIFSDPREKQVIKRLTGSNRGPVKNDSLTSIYAEIMSAARSLQSPFSVAYFGPETSFTHQAAIRRFGHSTHYHACMTIAEVFAEVEKGRVTCGVVPIENTTEGVVNHTLDMFMDSSLMICAEILLEVHHFLAAKSGNIGKIKKIYSHPQSFGQCREWLEENMRGAELIEVSNNAKAAELAAHDPQSAAICPELAARKWGLSVLAKNIEDSSSNVTRFFVISCNDSEPAGCDKTSIMFSIKDKVGALYDMLLPFRKNTINLTSIESRPSKKKAWDYYFFIDMLGHRQDKKIAKAIKELERKCLFLKILGSYPQANL